MSLPRPDAPVVIAWHLLDTPRSETALAAAIPLAGIDAWRIYLGLPLSGSRLPAGGFDAVVELAQEDAVLKVHGPITEQAAAEFGPAYAELQERLKIGTGPVGLLGGSLGGAVALQALADRAVDAAAIVLVNPLVQLRRVVDVLAPMNGLSYEWTDEAARIAERMDFVARADELGTTPLRIVLGENDVVDAFQVPAKQLRDALTARGVTAEVVMLPGIGHGFAEEPGLDPAPQTKEGAEVERHVADWFVRHLR